MGERASILDPKLQLHLTVRARRAGTDTSAESQDGDEGTSNQHAGLSQMLAEQHITQPRQQATAHG